MKGKLLDAIPLTTLHGVGASQADKLAKIGLVTIEDLLLHLPLRYEDQTHLYLLLLRRSLFDYTYPQPDVGVVLHIKLVHWRQKHLGITEVSFGRRKMMTCQISDGSGILTLRFFNFTAAMKIDRVIIR